MKPQAECIECSNCAQLLAHFHT